MFGSFGGFGGGGFYGGGGGGTSTYASYYSRFPGRSFGSANYGGSPNAIFRSGFGKNIYRCECADAGYCQGWAAYAGDDDERWDDEEDDRDYHRRDDQRRRSREHRHRRSREPTLSDVDLRPSSERLMIGSPPRRSLELNRPQSDAHHRRERSGTGGSIRSQRSVRSQRSGIVGPVASLPSGMTIPKSHLAKSALEMSDFDAKTMRSATVARRTSTIRPRSNTHNPVHRKSTAGGSTSSLAGIPPLSIRKKSRDVLNPARPRAMTRHQTQGTVDLKARNVVGAPNKSKGRRRSIKLGGSSL